MRLTDLSIRKLQPPEKGQKTHFDEALPGFGIRLSRRSKSFVVMFGKERRLKTIGRYPSVTLSAARREAKQILALQMPKHRAMSYKAACEAYLDECAEKNRPRTIKEYRRYLDSLEFAGTVDRIGRQHLRSYLTNPHALTAFKVFFNWCLRNELLDRNPLAGERAIYNHGRDRVLSGDELVRIYTTAEANHFGNIVKLLILTGQRRSEVAALHADWVDRDRCTISFPASITKNKRPHTIPYGPRATAILERLPSEGLLFGNSHGTPFSGWSKAKARLDRECPLEPWTLHDIRRTFSTIHAELGTPIQVTEKFLNHVSGTISGVAAVYNRHGYMDEMRDAIQRYENHLASLLGD